MYLIGYTDTTLEQSLLFGSVTAGPDRTFQQGKLERGVDSYLFWRIQKNKTRRLRRQTQHILRAQRQWQRLALTRAELIFDAFERKYNGDCELNNEYYGNPQASIPLHALYGSRSGEATLPFPVVGDVDGMFFSPSFWRGRRQ